MVIMTHQTISLEKYWKLLPATLKGRRVLRNAQNRNIILSQLKTQYPEKAHSEQMTEGTQRQRDDGALISIISDGYV